MLKNFLRGLFAILGGVAGYGAFVLVRFLFRKNGVDFGTVMTPVQQYMLAGVMVLLFAIIFYRLLPIFARQSRKVANNIGEDLRGVSASDIVAGTLGLIVGLVIALLITQMFRTIQNRTVSTIVTVATYCIMGYLGVVIGSNIGREVVPLILRGRQEAQEKEVPSAPGPRRSKKSQGIPKILDTSVIIDGRIVDIMKSGFIDGPIIIPEFVLVELRHIADSADSLRRTRGRRGLDILNKIQEEYGIEIYNTNNEKSLREIPEVDVKLLKLAQIMNGKVMTNDYNLNKVAQINGVEVLNINELANAVKPVVIPGEKMIVTPVKQGKDPNQSIAYLDDGTMVVVEDGRRVIGKTSEITVTSVLQTAAGRMIFGRLKVMNK